MMDKGFGIYLREDIACVVDGLEQVGRELEGAKREGYMLALNVVRLSFGLSRLGLPGYGVDHGEAWSGAGDVILCDTQYG